MDRAVRAGKIEMAGWPRTIKNMQKGGGYPPPFISYNQEGLVTAAGEAAVFVAFLAAGRLATV